MALVPIRCPSCGASVDLEEGQTLVRCAYCETTSYLPTPALPSTPQRHAAAAPRPGASRSTLIVILVAAALLIGALALVFRQGGVTSNYMEDATAVPAILVDELGNKTRFLTMTLSGRHTYVEVLEGDGTIVVHRFDGNMPRSPRAKGKAKDIALARKGAFTLDGIDFAVVGKIVAHAKKQVPRGEPAHVILQRRLPQQAELLWSAVLNVSGDHRTFYYTPAGEPLVNEPIDFIAAIANDGKRYLAEKLPKDTRIVEMTLTHKAASVEVVAAHSARDTDRYNITADGLMSAPVPEKSDGDPEALAAASFALGDVDGAAVERAVSDATKHLDGAVRQVAIRRFDGSVGFLVYARTSRGASRTARYDASGKRL